METCASLISEAAAALSSAGFEEPRRQARRLVASALAISRADLFGNPDRVVEHEPLSRILGYREFWGLEFALSGATLDPRPETETVVEAVLRRKPDRREFHRLLDLGTG